MSTARSVTSHQMGCVSQHGGRCSWVTLRTVLGTEESTQAGMLYISPYRRPPYMSPQFFAPGTVSQEDAPLSLSLHWSLSYLGQLQPHPQRPPRLKSSPSPDIAGHTPMSERTEILEKLTFGTNPRGDSGQQIKKGFGSKDSTGPIPQPPDAAPVLESPLL